MKDFFKDWKVHVLCLSLIHIFPSLFLEKYLYKLNSDGTVFEKVDLDTGECTTSIDNINNYFDTSIANSFYDVVDKRFRIETSLKVGEDEWEEMCIRDRRKC